MKTLIQMFEARAARMLLVLAAVTGLLRAAPARAQERAVRQATDAEVAAQADVKAYINPKQLGGGGGGGGSATNAIPLLNGRGTNTTFLNAGVTNTFTVTNANYLNEYRANGAFLRTNQIAPFDWEFHNTNGTITMGTNNVTKFTLTNSGDFTMAGTLATTGGGSNWLGNDTYINNAFITSNHVYLATVGGATSWANNTLYTNGPYRAVMRMDISSTSTASGSANQVFFHYTNNAVGRLEEAFFSLVNGNVDEREMEVELDPGATFKIDFIISTGGSITLFNQRLNPSF